MELMHIMVKKYWLNKGTIKKIYFDHITVKNSSDFHFGSECRYEKELHPPFHDPSAGALWRIAPAGVIPALTKIKHLL